MFVVNVWRPLCKDGDYVRRWPLAVCDASSVPPIDVVERESPENQSWIQQAFHRASHQWSFWPHMSNQEAILFKTFESDDVTTGRSQFALHCACEPRMSSSRDDHWVRESIETRLACFVVDPNVAQQAQKAAGIGSSRHGRQNL